MKLNCKGKEISPKAEARVNSALDAIVRAKANSHIEWDNYQAYVIVRKFSRWRILDIFPMTRVFVDIVDKTVKTEIEIPAEVFGHAYKKKGLGGRTAWTIRFRDLKAHRAFFSGKITVKMEGE